ncbi:MAG: DMT family transporter [Pseudomonadota bacterium]
MSRGVRFQEIPSALSDALSGWFAGWSDAVAGVEGAPPLAAALMALAAGASFGSAVSVQRLGLDHMDGRRGALIGIGASVLVFAIPAPFYAQAEWIGTRAFWLFAVCGLFMPALSTMLALRSVGLLGPGLAAATGSFGPFFALTLAAVFLGERFGAKEAAGLALMMTGLALSAGLKGPGGGARSWPLWALGFGLAAAFLRGAFQPIARVGLQEVPSPMFAALVMSLVSTVLLAGVHAASVERGRPWPRAGVAWFALAGVLNGFGIAFLNAALGAGEVVVAAPLASTTPLWALLFAALVFRVERISARHVAVAALVVAGAAMIVWNPG